MVKSSRVRSWEPSPRAVEVRRRAVLLSGLGLPLGLLAARAPQASAAAPATAARCAPSPRLMLPAPTGPYRLGTVSLDLIDPSRPDPWVPGIRFREMVVSMLYPAREVDDHPREPYFTPVVARAYEQQTGVPMPLNWPITHAHLHAPVLPREGGWPVVLYAPGLGDERNDTTAIAEDLVSHGYVVVTIDFVHDSGVVELPGGRLAESAVLEPTLPMTIKEVVSRAEDVSFILDQLAVINRGGNPDHDQRPLPCGLRGSLNLDQAGMLGHSDGGSTAAHVMHADSRVKAGVDMDGILWTQPPRLEARDLHRLRPPGAASRPHPRRAAELGHRADRHHQRPRAVTVERAISGHGSTRTWATTAVACSRDRRRCSPRSSSCASWISGAAPARRVVMAKS